MANEDERERQRKGVADRLGGAHLMVESNQWYYLHHYYNILCHLQLIH